MVTAKRKAILQHIDRFGMTLRPVLDRIFFGDVQHGCDKDISELRKSGLIDVAENAVADVENEKTRYSYYYLTRRATGLIGAPASRGNEPGPDAVAKNLAILWYCTMDKTRRYRLSVKEVHELLGVAGTPLTSSLPKGSYLLSYQDRYRIYNIYAPKTTLREITNELRKRANKVQLVPPLSSAIKSRQLAFLVLVESDELRKQVWKETQKLAAEFQVKFVVQTSPRSWKVN